MYEAGVRYVIQSESLAVLLIHLACPPYARARTRLDPDLLAMRMALQSSDEVAELMGSFAQGRAIRRQMHYQTLDKATFMKDYVHLHKADMEEEQQNPNRSKLARFL